MWAAASSWSSTHRTTECSESARLPSPLPESSHPRRFLRIDFDRDLQRCLGKARELSGCGAVAVDAVCSRYRDTPGRERCSMPGGRAGETPAA